MTFDELQKNWQEQQSGFRLNIDSGLLLKEVQRNQKSFASSIFWRDVREIGICIPMFILFLYWGLRDNAWDMFLIALGVLFIAVFMTVDRIAQRRKRPRLNGTLAGCLESSLTEVEHQIWLLKNVLWWYLLPPGIGFVALSLGMVISTIRDLGGNLFGLSICALVIAIFVLVFVGVYWLNQRAVRKELLPRKEELDELVASIRNGN
jgi:O-antigen/teichoic acid export membrane protein